MLMVSNPMTDHKKRWSVPLTLALAHILGFGTPSPGHEQPFPAGVKIATPQVATPPAPTPAPAPASKPASSESTVRDLLAALARFDQEGRNPAQKLGFELPEKAVNDYLVYALRTHPRPGVSAVTVSLLPRNEVSLSVELDFDAVPKTELQMVPEILRPMLTGKRTFKVNAGFEAGNGSITFHVKDAKGPEGSLIPQKILSEVLRAIGSRQPESYDPEKPNPLPFGVQRIWTEKQLICGET